MRYEVDILHYLSIYKKEWKRVVSLVSLAAFITAVMVLLQPTVYRSTVTVLSLKEGGQAGAIGRYLGMLSSVASSSDAVVFSMLESARMRRDVHEHFNLKDKQNFWWALDTYEVTGGFAVEVKAPDPDMTERIANFCVENLDKINAELQVTSQRPMAKVLDAAVKGSPVSKDIFKKVIAIDLFVFLIYALFIFFREYFSQLRKAKK